MRFSTEKANSERKVKQCRKFPLLRTQLKEQRRITNDIAETMTSTTMETGLSRTFKLKRRPFNGSYAKPHGINAVHVLLIWLTEKHRTVMVQYSMVAIFTVYAVTSFVVWRDYFCRLWQQLTSFIIINDSKGKRRT